MGFCVLRFGFGFFEGVGFTFVRAVAGVDTRRLASLCFRFTRVFVYMCMYVCVHFVQMHRSSKAKATFGLLNERERQH